MNRLLILPVLILTLLVGTPAFSADWDKGLTAYESGDLVTALREFTPLAEQGFAVVQSLLGWMYEKGQGVPKDNVYAHKWWDIAASSGDKDAVSGRDAISKRMNSTDISTAQKLARECVRNKYKGC
jgi:TPR repeat protein